MLKLSPTSPCNRERTFFCVVGGWLSYMQDQYINHIMNETGATVVLRGRGSGCLENQHGEEAQQQLHLLLSSSNQKSIDDAKRLAENLMDTISVEFGASRFILFSRGFLKQGVWCCTTTTATACRSSEF